MESIIKKTLYFLILSMLVIFSINKGHNAYKSYKQKKLYNSMIENNHKIEPIGRDNQFLGRSSYNLISNEIELHSSFSEGVAASNHWNDKAFKLYKTKLKPGFYQFTDKKFLAKNKNIDIKMHKVRRHFFVVPTKLNELKRKTLLIVPDITWQAYNRRGGYSFYTKQGPERKNRWLSLLRPGVHTASCRTPSHNPLKILERKLGNNVDIALQSDIESHLGKYQLRKYKLIVLYGHNEYWTEALRKEFDYAIRVGVNILNMSGNTMWWRINLEDNKIRRAKNFPHIIQSLGLSWRYGGYPLARKKKFVLNASSKMLINKLKEFGYPGNPEKSNYLEKSKGVRVLSSLHPIFKGTKLENGDWVGTNGKGIVRVEVDGYPIHSKIKKSLKFQYKLYRKELLAEAWLYKNDDINHSAVLMDFQRTEKSGRIISFGTIGWMCGLMDKDKTVELITSNAIELLSK